jgi:transcriptional regulator with XRE-family HTH domain
MKKRDTPSAGGTRLRQLRELKGMSQETLGRAVGLTTHTIWRFENAPTFNPRLEALRAIADVLGVKVTDLIVES